MGDYIFRIEKRTPDRPLNPEILVEFSCKEENPEAIVKAFIGFGELLKIYGTPEKVVEFMKRNAGVRRAELFVNEVLGR